MEMKMGRVGVVRKKLPVQIPSPEKRQVGRRWSLALPSLEWRE